MPSSAMSLRLLLPILALTQAITACSKDASPKREVQESGYSAASCLHKSNEGQDYSTTLSTYDSMQTLANNGIISTHFNKELDQKKINPVLAASVESIKKFIEQNTDLDLFAVTSDKGRCKPLAVLNYAYDQDLLDYWQNVNVDSDDNSFIAGVYRNVRGDKPFTIIREDANKYTLIHEYMHYVFDTHRINNKNARYAPEVVEDFKKTWSEVEYKCYFSCTEEVEQADLMRALKSLTEDTKDYLTTFLLEEVAIESLLIDAINTKQMTQTSQYDIAGANWYIEKSSERSLSILNSVQETLQSKISKIKDSNDIKTAKAYIEELKKLAEVVESYKTKAQVESAKIQKTYGLTSAQIPHKSCSHNHDHDLPF